MVDATLQNDGKPETGPWVLAMETAGRGGSLALGRGDRLVDSGPLPVGRRHNVQLAVGIDAMLKANGLTVSDLDAVAVALGPGSFTGIRVGVTTAKMMAHTAGLALIGVPSMPVLAANASKAEATCADTQQLAVALNTKRGTAYAGRFRRSADAPTGWQADGPADLIPFETITAWGLPVIGETLNTWLPDGLALPAELAQGDAQAVWQLALDRLGRGETDDPAKLAPLYIREPEAVTLWQERHPRPPEVKN